MKYLGPSQSGSDAGTTFSRNRFGQYTRRRAIPVNPATAAQLNVRARLALNAAAWRALTSSQRAGWNTLGSNLQRTDSLGQVYTFTGFMAYCCINGNKLAAGDAAVSDAPAVITPPTLLTATVTLTAAALSIAYTATPLAAGNRLFAFATPQCSAGINFNQDLRLIAVTAAAAASPLNLYAAYVARLGIPVVGNRIFFSLALYNGGFMGVPYSVNQTVA